MTESAVEIRGVTWDFDGERLDPWQAVQRLYRAGFTDAKVLAVGYAVMMGESGRYLRAWHNNVARNEDGSILVEEGLMTVLSTDLGFIQKNIKHPVGTKVELTTEAAGVFIESLFEANPKLARGDESAVIAWNLYMQRGWQPWYAYVNGNYKGGLPSAAVAVGNFLDKVLCDADGQQIKRKGA